MPYLLPDPDALFPLVLPDGSLHRGTVFLRPALDHPNIEAGAYSYYSDPVDAVDPARLGQMIAPYLYPGGAEKLVIGRFCQIAAGTRFITDGANHEMRGISTYPFAIFDPARAAGYADELPPRRDTLVGHDVWFGAGATVLPGARIGHGVIVGAGAVVGGEVPSYAVVAGNPARVVRMRFPTDVIARLLDIAWWDWPAERIAARADAIVAGDPDALA